MKKVDPEKRKKNLLSFRFVSIKSPVEKIKQIMVISDSFIE